MKKPYLLGWIYDAGVTTITLFGMVQASSSIKKQHDFV